MHINLGGAEMPEKPKDKTITTDNFPSAGNMADGKRKQKKKPKK